MKLQIRIRLCLLAIAVLLGNIAYAQKTLVKGIVQDSISHQGEPFASVRIFKSQSTEKPVAMFVTDKEGAFKQNIGGQGKYTLVISAVGRKDISYIFDIKNEAVKDLGLFYISDNVKTLKGVTVTAQKPLVKMEVDKMSYSVENDVDAKSNTVLDMLRKVPMVTVDGNDNITVNGSSNFKVYVDGKPNVMMSSNPSNVFKNMPASSIKNIEVITNPGAKYDAEGVGGVLNIIMNKEKGKSTNLNSTSATIRANVGNRDYGGGGYFAIQRGKFSMSVNANLSKEKSRDMNLISDREQTTSTGTSLMNTSSGISSTGHFGMGNFNMSYEIDSLRLVSASFGLMNFGEKMDSQGTTSFSGTSYNNPLSYDANTNTKMDYYSINGSVDYQRLFAGHKDRVLTLSYLLSATPNRNKSLNLFTTNASSSSLNLTDRYSDVDNKTIEHTFQLDYTTPLVKDVTFETGTKYILRSNSSQSDYYKVSGDTREWDKSNSMNYKHTNNILAAYTQLTAKLNKWTLKGGLRYEHTWQNVKYLLGNSENFKLNYGNLVPSGDFSYAISPSQNIGLAYNMRIQRPGISMLNPYVNKSDPTALSYGNTDLECEKTHNISMVYNLFTMKWVLNLTLRQSICNNAIQSYSFYDANNLLNTTYGNIVKERSTDLDAYINWNVFKNTRIMFNGGVAYSDLRSSQLSFSNNGWIGNAMVGLQQTLPLNIRLSVNMFAYTKRYTLQGYSTGFNAMMGSISRDFLKNRLNISLSAMSPLSGKKIEFRNYAKGVGFVSYSSMFIPLRSLSLSISYSIGGSSQVKKTRHTITNDDVKVEQSQTQQATNAGR